METWGFIWLMFALKVPIALLLWIVWWAIRQEPDPVVDTDEGDGGSAAPHDRTPRIGPRSPQRRPRGPHGDPSPPAPPRSRTPARSRDRVPHGG